MERTTLCIHNISTFVFIYLTDQIAQGTIKVHYCLTEAMTADYMTKPLQGELFRTHKKNIMGTPPSNVDAQECVDPTPKNFCSGVCTQQYEDPQRVIYIYIYMEIYISLLLI